MRKQKISFAKQLAALDGGKATPFTEKLLLQYEKGDITAKEFKKAILKEYVEKPNRRLKIE